MSWTLIWVKREAAELSTDHHLVVSWIRWQRRKLDRPGRPKRIVREVFQACPTGRRRPWGRPRTRWRDHVSRLAWERLGVPPEELEEVSGILCSLIETLHESSTSTDTTIRLFIFIIFIFTSIFFCL
ncbi:hypothetical protein L3Q82_000012 [Scortum barcoo]|uniref:Uncharacterized protein n=1 Tax=Scortum barcoo TaxID=214431 RepID=A0ACB8XBJ5_9TELE|nr:hypothetical protein L3Q82_000012 [Scortum barcoo]